MIDSTSTEYRKSASKLMQSIGSARSWDDEDSGQQIRDALKKFVNEIRMQDSLRTRMAKAIMESFSKDHEFRDWQIDPDMCYRTADRVTAEVLSELTGYHYEAKFHPTIIGPARFEHDGEYYG